MGRDGMYRRLEEGAALFLERFRPFAWIVMAVFVAMFSVILRPVALDAVDHWHRREMTEEERRLSFGLPFHVTKPPVGADHILNREQLRWIFLQEIRLDAMKSCIHRENEMAWKAFRQMVVDYNSRGSSYRSEASELRAARRDIEAYRREIHEGAVAEAEAMGWNKPVHGN